MPYTIFKVDETAPRLISPIIVALKKTLEKYNATVDWSTNFEDEEGYITIYYPEMASSLMLKILKACRRPS